MHPNALDFFQGIGGEIAPAAVRTTNDQHSLDQEGRPSAAMSSRHPPNPGAAPTATVASHLSPELQSMDRDEH
jgi:hypothetical protein